RRGCNALERNDRHCRDAPFGSEAAAGIARLVPDCAGRARRPGDAGPRPSFARSSIHRVAYGLRPCAMFKSAAEEIGQWADQCRRWARGARTREQKLMLLNLEHLLSQAALEAEDDLEADCTSRPVAQTKS